MLLAQPSAMRSFKRILIPIDFSDFSKQMVARCAETFADATGQVFHFLHVWHPPAFGYEGDPEEELKGRLEDFSAAFAPGGEFSRELDVVAGHPATEICDFAKKQGCDLIVMATHGRTGMQRLLIGSTAENVVRMAPCPVMTIRLAES